MDYLQKSCAELSNKLSDCYFKKLHRCSKCGEIFKGEICTECGSTENRVLTLDDYFEGRAPAILDYIVDENGNYKAIRFGIRYGYERTVIIDTRLCRVCAHDWGRYADYLLDGETQYAIDEYFKSKYKGPKNN